MEKAWLVTQKMSPLSFDVQDRAWSSGHLDCQGPMPDIRVEVPACTQSSDVQSGESCAVKGVFGVEG